MEPALTETAYVEASACGQVEGKRLVLTLQITADR